VSIQSISAAGTINGPASASDTSAEFLQSGGFETIDIASTNDAATLALAKISGVETVKAAANTKTITISSAGNGADADVWSFTLNGTTYSAAAVAGAGTQAEDEQEAALAIATKINTIAGFTASAAAGVVTVTNTLGERVDISGVDDSIATDNGSAAISAYTDLTISGVTTQAIDVFTADKVTVAWMTQAARLMS